MRSPWLLLAILPVSFPASLAFASPAEAQVGQACCVGDGKTKVPDPRHPQPIFLPAEVKRPDERALEASAEAPVAADGQRVNAIGFPLYPAEEDQRGVSEPELVPVIVEQRTMPVFDILPPCCRAEVIEPEDPPKIPVAA